MSVISPKIRGALCVNANPQGCSQNVQYQIDTCERAMAAYTLPDIIPKTVLIIGGSAGYGLASRIVSQVFFKAQTISVVFEKEPSAHKTGSAGWYNNFAVNEFAVEQGNLDIAINADAFQASTKQQVIDVLKQRGLQVDLLVYSVAAPRRSVPENNTEVVYQSVIKPIDQAFTGQTYDINKGQLQAFAIDAASAQEIQHTIKVMGGEDWQLWVQALQNAAVLAADFQTVAFSYLGGDVTRAIYHDGTLGRAKEDLEKCCENINGLLAQQTAQRRATMPPAKVAVLKAIVTQSSAAIPSLSVYISALYKVMKEQGNHEDCIAQIIRLFTTGLYPPGALTCNMDKRYRLRFDEFELQADTQAQVKLLVEQIKPADINGVVDFAGFQRDFLQLFGFAWG